MIGLFQPPPLNPSKRTAASQLVGSEVAARDFTRAMARHLPPPSVALCVDGGEVETVRHDLSRLYESEGGHYGTVQVLDIRSLPAALARGQMVALHFLMPELHPLAYLRDQFAPRPIPVTCTPHGFSAHGSLWDFFYRLALTPTRSCDSVICTSEHARRAFANCLGRVRDDLRARGLAAEQDSPRLDVLPLGIDIDVFRPRDRADARCLLGLPQNKLILLYFGRLDHIGKADLNPLLLAFRNLVDKHGAGRLTLVVAGAEIPGECARIQQAAASLGCAEQVWLRPNPSLVEGPLYYAAADVFVGLSDTLQESFGLAPLEAMACGLPVVVSDWSGYRETVRHGESGFRVPTLWGPCDREAAMLSPILPWYENAPRLTQAVAIDVERLRESLDVLISNPDLRGRMGQSACERTRTCFAWEAIVPHYLALWQELAAVSLTDERTARGGLSQYYADFGHFATHRLDGSERVCLTALGRQACRRRRIDLHQPEAPTLLDFGLLLTMLNYVRMVGFLKSPLLVRNLCERIGTGRGQPEEVVLIHLLWLAKYGLLDIASGGGPASAP